VDDVDVFQTVDLWERKDIAQVVTTLFALGRTVRFVNNSHIIDPVHSVVQQGHYNNIIVDIIDIILLLVFYLLPSEVVFLVRSVTMSLQFTLTLYDNIVNCVVLCSFYFRHTNMLNGKDLTWDQDHQKNANVTSPKSNCEPANQ